MKSVPWWSVIVALVVGLFGGSGGAYWRWKSSRVEDVKVTIDTAMAILEIRSRMDQLLKEIVPYLQDGELREKHILEFQAKVDAYNAAEREVAKLEGRPAVKLEFQTAAPTISIN